jgi:hypothetical protein
MNTSSFPIGFFTYQYSKLLELHVLTYLLLLQLNVLSLCYIGCIFSSVAFVELIYKIDYMPNTTQTDKDDYLMSTTILAFNLKNMKFKI